jgi:alpha-beta hydrolase superfamily lysophospholipase
MPADPGVAAARAAAHRAAGHGGHRHRHPRGSGRTGRTACPAHHRRALLAGWDGQLTPALRRRAHRHIERCATCTTRRVYELRPAVLLGLSAGAALAAAAAESLRLAGRNVPGATLTINPGGASYPLVVNSGF